MAKILSDGEKGISHTCRSVRMREEKAAKSFSHDGQIRSEMKAKRATAFFLHAETEKKEKMRKSAKKKDKYEKKREKKKKAVRDRKDRGDQMVSDREFATTCVVTLVVKFSVTLILHPLAFSGGISGNPAHRVWTGKRGILLRHRGTLEVC